MASIREVAKIAGVSPATVSRVMNGTANVDEEKKQRVLEAIQETGFKPNELARALFKKSSKIIGMIVPNIENPFFSEIAKAVESLFNVTVDKVNTMNCKGKAKRMGAHQGYRPDWKKAIVTLTADSKGIEFFESMM